MVTLNILIVNFNCIIFAKMMQLNSKMRQLNSRHPNAFSKKKRIADTAILPQKSAYTFPIQPILLSYPIQYTSYNSH